MTTFPASGQPDDAVAQRLQQRQAELGAFLQDAAAAALHAADAQAEVSDFKELAGEGTDAALRDSGTEQALRELAQTEHALRRLREGSYGVCEECGDAIAPARLLARPASTLCAACQAARERQDARHG